MGRCNYASVMGLGLALTLVHFGSWYFNTLTSSASSPPPGISITIRIRLPMVYEYGYGYGLWFTPYYHVKSPIFSWQTLPSFTLHNGTWHLSPSGNSPLLIPGSSQHIREGPPPNRRNLLDRNAICTAAGKWGKPIVGGGECGSPSETHRH